MGGGKDALWSSADYCRRLVKPDAYECRAGKDALWSSASRRFINNRILAVISMS